jgi:integron integrase
MGAEHITAYLTHLAQNREVAATTQNQALNALIFLYREVMGMKVEGIDAQRAKRKKRLPVVLTKEEVNALLANVTGEAGLLCQLLYGCGLRVSETLSLRIKDVHLEAGNLEIRGGKGDKDRTVTLPKKLLPLLMEQRTRARILFEEDRKAEEPGVALPHATETKNPSAGTSWPWFWFWPSRSISTDPRSRTGRRHHMHDIGVTRELAKATERAGITRRVTSHALRHSYATHLVLRGVDIRSIQNLLGHSHVSTTEIYTELAKSMRGEITSPLDDL